MLEKRISVIVVNWNAGEQLSVMARSVAQFHEGIVRELIVFDNGSSDDSLERLDLGAQLPFELIIMRSDSNLGFAAGCNRAAHRATGDYLLFLNPDAALYAGCLSKTTEFMETRGKSASVGICGVQLMSEHGQVQRHSARFPTFRGYFGHCTGLSRVFPRAFPYHFMDDFDHMSSRQVDHVIGAYYFVRSNVFERLGGFDEDYFVYLEDLDFSLRARRAGWGSYYLAEARGFHKGGGVSEQVKAHRMFYSLRSRIIYARKHFSRVQYFGIVLLTVLVEPWPRLVRAIMRRSWQELRDTVHGYLMLYVDLPRALGFSATHRPAAAP